MFFFELFFNFVDLRKRNYQKIRVCLREPIVFGRLVDEMSMFLLFNLSTVVSLFFYLYLFILSLCCLTNVFGLYFLFVFIFFLCKLGSGHKVYPQGGGGTRDFVGHE